MNAREEAYKARRAAELRSEIEAPQGYGEQRADYRGPPPDDTDRQFYAFVEIREFGEEPRERRIGPFYAESEDDLRFNLEQGGDTVNRIEVADA